MSETKYVVNKGRAIMTKKGIKGPGQEISAKICNNFEKLKTKKPEPWIIPDGRMVVNEGENINVAKPEKVDLAAELEKKRHLRVLPKISKKEKKKKEEIEKIEKENKESEIEPEINDIEDQADEEKKPEITQFGATKKDELD